MSSNLKTIGIVCSSEFECDALKAELKNPSTPSPDITTGELFSIPIIIAVSGMGMVNAARAATVLVEKYNASDIINIGIAGAYPNSDLEIGDVVSATEEIYAEAGIEAGGVMMPLEETGLPLVHRDGRKFYNRFPLENELSLMAAEMARASGVFLTVATITGTNERAAELEERFMSPLCENMEGAACAHICAHYGIPFAQLRGISNIVEKRDLSRWDKQRATTNCQLAAIALLRRIGQAQ